MIEPLTLVLSVLLSAPASAAAQCSLTGYEAGPKGLKTAQTPIASCADVEKLSPEEQELFRRTRKAVNDLPNDAQSIPAVLKEGKKFLTKGELYYLRSICVNEQAKNPDADPAQFGCPL